MGRRRKKKLIVNVLIIAAVAIALFALFYFYGSPKNSPKNNPPTAGSENAINIKDAPALVEETNTWSINAVYPQTGQDYIDSEVKDLVNGQIADFRKIFVDLGAPSSTETKNTLSVDYSSQLYGDSILSFKFVIGWYTGGAHPNENLASLVFDLKNKKELSLSDLFIPNSNYLQKISGLTISQLVKRNISDPQAINAGAGPIADNYKIFNVYNGALVIYFPPYAVAPYAAGEQKVEIPLSQIKDILNPSLFSGSDNAAVSQNSSGFALDYLAAGDRINSPLSLSGSVSGNGWNAYEGQAGRVDLLDSSGNLMASSSLSAVTNWAQLPVKFNATLTFIVPAGMKEGQLVFYNKNISNKAADDKQVVLPITFSSK
ncbi:MAG: DUF3298 domain-containing protein [Candidatus Paceibacterota bacterium]